MFRPEMLTVLPLPYLRRLKFPTLVCGLLGVAIGTLHANVPDDGKEPKSQPAAGANAEQQESGSGTTPTSSTVRPTETNQVPNTSGRDRSARSTGDAPPKSDRELAEDRKAREAARKRGEISFDDLKFDIEKDGLFKPEMITPEIKELEKKTFKLRGFILPISVFQQSGIKQFVLVRDNKECCFGPGAALYDCVMVTMAPGKSATFSTRVVTVKGKLEIDSESYRNEEGGHYAIYKMTAEEVR
jgi:hypothetical protein